MSTEVLHPEYFFGIFILLVVGFILRARLSRKSREMLQAKGVTSYGLINERELRKYTRIEDISLDTEPLNESLRCSFLFKGESWDALEVLNLESASIDDLTKYQVDIAYQKSLRAVDYGSRAYIDQAYESLKQRVSSNSRAQHL